MDMNYEFCTYNLRYYKVKLRFNTLKSTHFLFLSLQVQDGA